MEHRWGERMEMDLPVLLNFGGPRIRKGRLRNVSISGCRVDVYCSGKEHSDSAVDVALMTITERDEAIHLTGCIVRRTSRVLGIEWTELSPPGIATLMQRLSPALADSRPGRPPPLYR
jgi:hypothetical protein